MRFLGTLLLFTGYTLVYASVAVHGKFAHDPWFGLFADAYIEQQQQDAAKAEAAKSKKTDSSGSGASDFLNPIQPVHGYNLGIISKINSTLGHGITGGIKAIGSSIGNFFSGGWTKSLP